MAYRKLDLSKVQFSDEIVSMDEALKNEPSIAMSSKNIVRPCTVAESIVESFKEVKLMREGKLPKKTWRDLYHELKEEDAQLVHGNTNAKI